MPGRLIVTLAAALAVALMVPSSATAATEVGDDCGATIESPATYTNVPDAKAPDASPLPIAAPVGGIVTSWRVKSLSGETVPIRMGVFRKTGEGKFLVAAASAQETMVFGLNTFKTRIPVESGDRFGLIPVGEKSVYCLTGNTDDHSWSYNQLPVEVGSEYQFGAGVDVRVPVVAVIEPDVDGDGFGDETQDGCPQSAATQAPCPAVTTTFTMKPKGNAIIAKVRVSSAASVQVFGQVSWQVRGKPKTSARNHGLTVAISAGGPRAVSAGETKTYKVPLSKPILRRLGRITPKQALRAVMTVRTTDVAGRMTDQRRRLKLNGRQGA